MATHAKFLKTLPKIEANTFFDYGTMTMARFPTILLPPTLKNLDPNNPDVFHQTLSQTIKPVAAHYKPPRGHSESQFEYDLWRYFPGKIHTGLLMPRPDQASPYTPDFTYIDPCSNLHIDIEVDEPYTYDTRQPLHYLNCPKDQQRNRRFLEWGWVVIRFSEVQVVKHPASCCKTIASVVGQITGDNSLMVSFRQVPTLKPEPCWTHQDAKHMAEAHYRESYLTQSQPEPKSSKRKRRKQNQPFRSRVLTANFTFYCPECGEGPIRWQGHYICCPNCQYDAFAL
jgi:very-short-patch-repair endonuclease